MNKEEIVALIKQEIESAKEELKVALPIDKALCEMAKKHVLTELLEKILADGNSL